MAPAASSRRLGHAGTPPADQAYHHDDRPVPPEARAARWAKCQSVGAPAVSPSGSALYWHIAAIQIRLGMVSVIPALVTNAPHHPTAGELREVVRIHALLPEKRRADLTTAQAVAAMSMSR